jgi:ribosome-binding factor A
MLRRALSDILAQGNIRHPDLKGRSVTITEVQVAPDMRTAVAYCTSLGGQDEAVVVDALNRCRVYVRGQLGRMITLKFTPSLKFRSDTTFDEVQSVDALLRSPKVAKDIAADESEKLNGEAT